MGDIFVIAEHRQGKLREITLEMLSAAAEMAKQMSSEAVAVLLGSGIDSFADTVAGYSDRVLYIDDPVFKDYNSENYQRALSSLMSQYKPDLVMVGHTAHGVDLAPALAVEMKTPFVTDVIDMEKNEGDIKVTRQYYQGKVNADYLLTGKRPYLVTIRESCFEINEPFKQGKVNKIDSPFEEDIAYRRFIEYIEEEQGDIDITKSTVLVGVGRGIQEEDNMDLVEDLAKAINADICGSRAAVDAGWVSKDRQVGISGKRVKPSLYIAVGISGAFQHLVGMSGARTIVAINKDAKAPIFSVANYAIIDDLFKVVPKLTEKFKELRG
jgi:electron transfer flavoprotein alpha subunit